MADSPLDTEFNLVTWTLSGTYDEEKPVLVDANAPTRWLSRRTATELIAKLAGSFPPQQVICLHMSNDILYPVLVLAILASGCTWTGTNPAYTRFELQHHFDSAEVDCVITSTDDLPRVQAAIAICSRSIEVILSSDIVDKQPTESYFHSDSVERYRTLCELLGTGERVAFEKLSSSTSPDSIATIMATSGTTGLSKMLGRTHRALIRETVAVQDNDRQKPYTIRRLYCTPIFHAYSFPQMVVNALRLGHTSYFLKRFDDTFATKIQEFSLTETMAVPAMLMRLADLARGEAGRSKMQSLRQVSCAGAPLTEAVRSRFLAVFDNPIRLIQVWGMTEGGCFTTFKFPEEDHTGSVGRAVTGTRIRMSQDMTAELADGTKVAELHVKSPQLTTCYLGDGKSSAQTFNTDRWMRTGDIGYICDGKVYLVDRAKNCIKVNGWTVSPTELEAALAYSPLVVDAAVVGCQTGVEEHPIIFVVPRQPNVSAQEIKDYMLGRLAKYKISKSEVRFVGSLPRNSAGKLFRDELQESLR